MTKVVPRRSLWILGDNLLDDAAPKLLTMGEDQENILYIHEHYQVRSFQKGYGKYAQNNPYIKICENLVEAIKEFPYKLPYIIVILLGNHYAHDEPFVDFEFKDMINNILDRIQKILQDRKDQLPKKATSEREPLIAIMRLLPKPAYCLRNVEKFKATRKRANNIIENATVSRRMLFINADEINCSQKCLFTKQGHLSDDGFERMWASISDAIMRMDRTELDALNSIGRKTKIAITQTPAAGVPLIPDRQDHQDPKRYDHQLKDNFQENNPSQVHNYQQAQGAHFHQHPNHADRSEGNADYRKNQQRTQDRFHYYKR